MNKGKPGFRGGQNPKSSAAPFLPKSLARHESAHMIEAHGYVDIPNVHLKQKKSGMILSGLR